MKRKPSAIILVVALAVAAILCGPSTAAAWFSDSFDSYTAGNLVGQGGWAGTAGRTRVETTFVKSGKSVEADFLSWGAGDATHTVSSGGGYHYVDVDVAMDTICTTYANSLGYIKVFGQSGSNTVEITRIYYAHRQFRVLLGPGNPTAIVENVPARTWYHIRLGINLTAGTMDVWVDGVQKVTGAPTYSPATSITAITFGQWSTASGFTKAETYVDNIVCAPPDAAATKILSPSDSWESRQVCYPCVIYDQAAGGYKMFYSGTGGAEANESAWSPWATGIATSTDLLTWARKTDDYEPVLYARKFMEGDLVDPDETAAVFDSMFAIGPCVLKDGVTYKMWYTGWNGQSEHIGGGIDNLVNFRVGYATSTDAVAWTKHPGAAGCGSVVGLGAGGSADAKGAVHPYVLKEGSTYRMWYEGFDGSTWRILYATSPDGTTWTKQGTALSVGGSGALDELGLRNPVVISRNGQYELWYQGKSSSPPNYHVMRAASPDGLTWTKASGEVGLHPDDPLDGDERILVDSVLVQGDNSCRVFFAKENTTNTTVTYGVLKTKAYSIYTEVVNP